MSGTSARATAFGFRPVLLVCPKVWLKLPRRDAAGAAGTSGGNAFLSAPDNHADRCDGTRFRSTPKITHYRRPPHAVGEHPNSTLQISRWKPAARPRAPVPCEMHGVWSCHSPFREHLIRHYRPAAHAFGQHLNSTLPSAVWKPWSTKSRAPSPCNHDVDCCDSTRFRSAPNYRLQTGCASAP